jgi:hypothetical protein
MVKQRLVARAARRFFVKVKQAGWSGAILQGVICLPAILPALTSAGVSLFCCATVQGQPSIRLGLRI